MVAVIHIPLELVGSKHIAERIIERSQVWVDLVVERAGQETEVFAGFHGRTGENDATNLLVLKSTHCFRHGQIGLTGTCRANAKSDGMRFDRI